STICVTSRSWVTTKKKIRKSWRCLSKRLSSTFAWRHCCATITSPARSQPHRKFVSQPYIKKNNAQEGVMVISHQEYSHRRQALLAKMQPGSAALIFAAPEVTRSADSEYP